MNSKQNNVEIEIDFSLIHSLAQKIGTPEKVIRGFFIGDIIGKPGRKIVKKTLPQLKQILGIDFVLANAENVAGGFGVTEKTFQEITASGVNIATFGNHWNDKPDIHQVILKYPNTVLPQNLPNRPQQELFPEFSIPGLRQKILVINFLGNFAMKHAYGNPFELLNEYKSYLQTRFNSGEVIIVADIHAEASSEKQVLGYLLDGLAAVVFGTHTHTPTSDDRILPKGTAFISDLGMTGPYNSIIGMDVERTCKKYMLPHIKGPHEVAGGPSWLCGFLVEISLVTNVSIRAHRLQFREENNQWSINSVFYNNGNYE